MPRVVSGKDVCNVEIHQGVDGWPQAYLLKISTIPLTILRNREKFADLIYPSTIFWSGLILVSTIVKSNTKVQLTRRSHQ